MCGNRWISLIFVVLLSLVGWSCDSDSDGAGAGGVTDTGAPGGNGGKDVGSADTAVAADVGQTADTGSAAAGIAPADLAGKKVVLAETGAVTNTWTFPAGSGTAGTATLEGAGDFPFTYEKTGEATSVLEFDVGGKDRYEMTWTSATGGTFAESFDGQPGTTGTFTVE